MKLFVLLCSAVLISVIASGFRVTKDYGNGVKVYEDSKRGTRSISLDGGNMWWGGNSSGNKYGLPQSFLSQMKERDNQDALVDAVEKQVCYQFSNNVYIVRSGRVVEYDRKQPRSIGIKLKTGQMSINYEELPRYIYFKKDMESVLTEFSSDEIGHAIAVNFARWDGCTLYKILSPTIVNAVKSNKRKSTFDPEKEYVEVDILKDKRATLTSGCLMNTKLFAMIVLERMKKEKK